MAARRQPSLRPELAAVLTQSRVVLHEEVAACQGAFAHAERHVQQAALQAHPGAPWRHFASPALCALHDAWELLLAASGGEAA